MFGGKPTNLAIEKTLRPAARRLEDLYTVPDTQIQLRLWRMEICRIRLQHNRLRHLTRLYHILHESLSLLWRKLA
jgi:hypothetical protein